MNVFRPWVQHRVAEILGVEDDILADTCINEIEEGDEKGPDPRKLVINMTATLEQEAEDFVKELWGLLLEA